MKNSDLGSVLDCQDKFQIPSNKKNNMNADFNYSKNSMRDLDVKEMK